MSAYQALQDPRRADDASLLIEGSFQARVLIPMVVSIPAGLVFATVLTPIPHPVHVPLCNAGEVRRGPNSVAGRVWGVCQPSFRSATGPDEFA